MLKNILSIALILVLLLTFVFGYTGDNNITNEDNFQIDIEEMDSWTSTLLNSFNNYLEEIKADSMNKYLDVMEYFSNIGKEFNKININEVKDIFNRDNIFTFFKSFMSIIIAPFYVLYSISLLLFNIVYLTSKLVVNLVLTCIDIGRILS